MPFGLRLELRVLLHDLLQEQEDQEAQRDEPDRLRQNHEADPGKSATRRSEVLPVLEAPGCEQL